MEKITLKNTDLTISRAVMGTMTFGSQVDERVAIRMVEACLDRGVNFFDTANVYNAGVSEIILGKALTGRRSRVIVASKVFGKMGDGPDQRGLSRAAILRAVEESLLRLGTDYLDVYYLHQPDYSAPIEETLAAMEELVRVGKVRYPACSNYASWQVAEMRAIAEKNSYKPIHISQPMYNLLARGIEQEYLPMCRRFGVSSIVYNPLAGGLLTGKQQRREPISGTRFDNNKMYLDRYWHDDQFDAVDALKEIAEREKAPIVEMALHWLLKHSAADAVILGASSMEQLTQNLNAVENAAALGETALRQFDVIWKVLRGVAPQYNR